MEGLIMTLKEVVHKDIFKDVALPNNGPNVANLHYADDALFISE